MMKFVSTSFASLMFLSMGSISAHAENLLENCVRWYPNRIDWCKQQYPSLADTSDLSLKNKSASTSDSKSAGETDGAIAKGNVEAITSISKNSNRTVLFVDIKQSGNVLCAEDAPSWVLAEKDGTYYAINGLARSWVSNMKVYRSGKWYAVKDGGAGSNMPFSTAQAYDLIKIGNELCPMPPGGFVDALSRRVTFGEEQARQLGDKYGL